MLNILSTFLYQNGAVFPNTQAINSTGPFTTDGTEFIAALVNDYNFGPMQSLLDYTGQVPNGIVESPLNSQFLEGLRRAFSYPGEVFTAAFNQDPAILGIRALKLTGQGILRTNYPLLDLAVYVGDGNNGTAPAFYRSDDSAGTIRNITGIYLKLPDARGRVIRGLDLAAIVDPQGASRRLGGLQGFAVEDMNGSFWIRTPSTGGTIISPTGVFSFGPPAPAFAPLAVTGGTVTADTIDFNASNDVTVSTETRMTNIAFDYYIRF